MLPIVVKKLLEYYKEDIEKRLFLFVNNHDAEPLYCIYSPQVLAKIFTLYNAHQLTKQSMKYVLYYLTVSQI